MPVQPSLQKASWYGIPFRVLFVTFLVTLLSFALSLLLGILGTLLVAKTRHVAPDMRIAYRSVAIPAAIVVCAMAFFSSLAMEIRHYRQAKALARIEKQVLN
jgi:hypothetical protein